MLSASMLTLLDISFPLSDHKRMVVGIDIDIRKHNRDAIESHPFVRSIKMIEGSSIDNNIAKQVMEYAKNFRSVMICLDSNHAHNHVLNELELYAGLVSVGNYCIVWDTIVEDMPEGSITNRPWGKGNNPKTAVWEFLKGHSEFEIDRDIQNKLLITVAPDGYLRRVL
jgi:cephalosporin hydroxylase